MRVLLGGLLLLAASLTTAIADDQVELAPEWAACRARDQDPQAALVGCNRLIESGKLTQEHLAWAYMDRGLVWENLRRADQAEADLLKAESVYPADWKSYYNLAPLLRDLGRYEESVDQSDRAIARIPILDVKDLAWIHCGRGQALQALDRSDEALESYEAGFKASPGNECVAERLAGAYRGRKRYDDAIGVLDQALEAIGPDFDLLYERGAVYREMQRFDLAFSAFNQALAIAPRNVAAMIARADLYDRTGQPGRAIADFTTAIALRPNYAEGYSRRASVYDELGRYNAAMADCDRVIALVHRDVGCWHLQMEDAMALGDFKAAVNYATTLIDDGEQDYLLYRGAARFATGDLAGAESDFVGFTEAQPEIPYGWVWLHLAERGLGKDDSAKLAEMARRREAWPHMVIRYAAGQVTAEQLLASTDVPDPDLKRQRRAEAEFYMGELAALAGDTAAAKDHFKRALAIGRAQFDLTKNIVVYKPDDDLELAVARAALHDQGY